MMVFLLEKKKRKRRAQSRIRRFANEFAPERISCLCVYCIIYWPPPQNVYLVLEFPCECMQPIRFDSIRAPGDGRPWSPLFSSRPFRSIVFYLFSVRRSPFSYRPSILLVPGKESPDEAFSSLPFEGGSFDLECQRRPTALRHFRGEGGWLLQVNKVGDLLMCQ